MTSEIEAVGDAVTGGLIAHAVEPANGEGEAGTRGSCLNCGAKLAGSFCHVCGQNGQLHRTIASFVHDLLHGVFHFEGKIWRTLPMLVFKPGELTRRYITGERVKFVSPLAMFLFCTFLMFAVVGSLAGEMRAPNINVDAKIAEIAKQPEAEIERKIATEQAALAALRAQVRELDRGAADTKALDVQADLIEANIEELQTARDVFGGVAGTDTVKADGTKERFTLFGGIDTGWPALDRGIKSANENPNLFLYRMQTSAYKYSWLLIPISTPMVWLLFFWKRKYKFYDHLVFVTFSLTFMLLMVATLVVASAIGLSQAIVTPAAMIIPPIHMFKQMRGAYASAWITALIRTFILIIFAFFALAIYLAILVALGVTH
ncbi:MAG: DUF3667 domain-containing protein [Dokdonella sp.]